MRDFDRNMSNGVVANSWIVSGGLYVITGGSGVLARALAQHLLAKADVQVALLSRRNPREPIPGARHVAVDLTDVVALTDALADLRNELGPVRGVFHLAGTTRDGALISKSFSDFDAVLCPKTYGLRNLDKLTSTDPLEVFVGFSSVAAVTGNAGQSDYAIANAFMDNYLVIRQKRVAAGERCGQSLSINWPYWAEGGMHPRDGRDPTAGHASGVEPLTLEAGFNAMDKAIRSGHSGVVVFAGDRDKLAAWIGCETPLTPSSEAEGPAVRKAETIFDLALPKLIGLLLAEIAELLHFPLDELSDRAPLGELGFDSITFTGLAERLNKLLELGLTPPELFDAETIEDMAQRLLTAYPALATVVDNVEAAQTKAALSWIEPTPEMQDFSAVAADKVGDKVHDGPETNDPIVICGLEVRLPGAGDADAFWCLLEDNKSAITTVPPMRWPMSAGVLDQGGFITGIDQFDPLFFGISPREAGWMDPQQRILLECVWHALEDAGLRRKVLTESRTGVFVGASSNDYGMLISEAGGQMSPHHSTGLSHAILPNRISHVLDLIGPSESVDTACSSSLVALNRALRALRDDECNMAIVAGVNAMLSPGLFISFNASGMLSPSGRCHTFDAAADGYVRGEGVGAIVLTRLSEARKLGLRVRAVLRGAAVNHVGHTSSLTVPSLESQAELIRAALDDSGLTTDDIDVIEAHGTGTRLGDPIEVAALCQLFGPARDALPPLAVSSVKPNIGHLEAAAGIAGIASAVLSLQAGRVPGNPELHNCNPFISLDGSRVQIVSDTQDWPSVAQQSSLATKRPARIGVSSFGFGGTCAHVILEEAPTDAVPANRKPLAIEPVPILLSGHSDTALLQGIADLADTLQNLSENDLPYLAAALVRQRDPRDYRLALIAEDLAQLRAALDEAQQHGTASSGPRVAPDFATRQMQDRAFDTALSLSGVQRAQAIANLFRDGAELDWSRAFETVPLVWMDLPATRFDHARYWFSDSQATVVNLTAGDPIFSDHVVGDDAVLPGMASVALLLEESTAGLVNATAIENVRFLAQIDLETIQQGIRIEASGDERFLIDVSGNRLVAAAVAEINSMSFDAVSVASATKGAEGPDEALYDEFARRGIAYGPVYRRLAHAPVEVGSGRVTVRLAPAPVGLSRRAQVASALDAALQAAVGLVSGHAPLAIPIRADRIELYGDLEQAHTVVAKGQTDSSVNYDIAAVDGKLLARLTGIRFAEAPCPVEQSLRAYIADWQPEPLEDACVTPTRLVIASGDQGLLLAMAETTVPVPELAASVPDWDWLQSVCKGAVVVLDARGAILEAADWPRLVQLVISSSGLLILQDRAQQAIAGLLRCATAEHTGSWFKTLEIDTRDTAHLARILGEEARQPEIAELRYPADGPRLVRYLQAVEVSDARPILQDAVVLVTGGFGGIGQALAEDLRSRNGAKVALIGRSAPPESLRASALADDGIMLLQADVADPAQLAKAVVHIGSELGPIRHVFHLAGIIEDKPALGTTSADYLAVAHPKIVGLRALLEDSGLANAQSIIAFSSVAALFGNAGQAAYAAANGGCSDLLARQHDARLRVIDWPLWRDGGMWSDMLAERYADLGLVTLDPMSGFQMLYRLIECTAPHVAIIATDSTAPDTIKLRNEIGQAPVAQEATSTMPPDALRSFLEEEITAVLGLRPGTLRGAEGLERYGLDSALILELTERLERRFGSLPKTLFFEYPTLNALADHFANKAVLETDITNAASSRAVGAPTDEVKMSAFLAPIIHRDNHDAVAIVGLSGRFPGAHTLEILWQNLEAGVDSVGPIPPERWREFGDMSGVRGESGVIYLGEGGFLDGYDCFDPGFFRIPTRDAKRIDPQERLFLTECWRTLENAGYPPERLSAAINGDVGVYAGVMWSEYQLFGRFGGVSEDRISLSSSFASIANRVSFFMGLKGPSLAVDSMCSSSLTSLHLACTALRNGECRMALAGGVNLSLHPNKFLQLSQSNFASDDGRCRSFGQGGTGYGPGEGVGVALLRPLSDALAAGDNVLAVILGSALNHGGAATGYTVPDPAAQAEVIARAWAISGRDPCDADYIEAHGTGTPLGDPIEIRGLAKVFKGHSALPIGSIKSNLGHLEAAAGIAAVAKVVGQMQREVLFPTVHAQPPNPDLGIEGTGMRVQTSRAIWKRRQSGGASKPYLSGISSFGAGGANAHLVIEEMPADEFSSEYITASDPQLVLLSARSQTALEQRITDLKYWLSEHPAIRLDDLAFTLAHGRSHFERRFAIVANDIVGLCDALDGILAGRPDRNVYSTEFLSPQNGGLDIRARTAESYVSAVGKDPLENDLWSGRVVLLPTYPFDERRIWVGPRHSANNTSWETEPAPTGPPKSNTSPLPLAEPPSVAGERVAMPKPSIATISEATESVAPRTEILDIVREAVAAQLEEEVNAIDPDRPFADFGVDSIHAVQIARRIGDRLGRVVPVAEMYSHATPSRLAEWLAMESGDSDLATPIMAAVSRDAITQSPVVTLPEHKDDITGDLLHRLLQVMGKVLDEDPASLEAERPFRDLGMDSVHNVQIARILSEQGISITANDLFEFPTAARLAEHLNSADAIIRPIAVPTENPAASILEKHTAQAVAAIGDTLALPALALSNPLPAFEPMPADLVQLTSLEPNARTVFGNSTQDSRNTEKRNPLLLSVRPSQQDRYTALIRGPGAMESVGFVRDQIGAPDPGLVEIEVRASTLSLSDLMRMQGTYPEMPDYPFAAGVEVAGIVTRVGPGVSTVNPGTRVVAMMSKTFGGHATLVHAHEAAVIEISANMTFEQAVTLPSSFLTAYYGLIDLGGLSRGETVLVHSAASALGQMAIQLVRDAGGVVIGTTSRADKAEILREQGIETVINHDEEDFAAAVMQATDGRGVDIVLNMLGPSAIQSGIDCLAIGGRYLEAALGALKAAPKLDLSSLAEDRSVRAIGLRAMLWKRGPDAVRHYMNLMSGMLRQGRIAPLPMQVFPMSDLQAAIAHIQSRKSIGRTVLRNDLSQVADGAEPLPFSASDDSMVKTQAPVEEVAVIGMAARFGSADSLDAVERTLFEGRDLVGPVPEKRRELGFASQEIGSFVEDIDMFDPHFFDITPAEAEWMDPQQRILLEEVWFALEDAGVPLKELRGSQTGVFVGARGSGYAETRAAADTEQGRLHAFTGGLGSILAGRISYTFDLHGPAVTVDTACSSGLVALDMAAASIARGECDMAIVAGISIGTAPGISPGKATACRAFSDDADGFVIGEGVGVLVLRGLRAAMNKGDRVHGVVLGTAVNQDGLSNGLLAPNGGAQKALLQEAWDKAGICGDKIGMIEAHGTGTVLGDPVEFGALQEVMEHSTDRRQFCTLGSCKSNFGHALAAAGIAGVIKVLLALRNQVIPPSLHFDRPNSRIDFANSAFHVPTQSMPWTVDHGQRRIGAVSAFGFSGTNAHAVLSEVTGQPKVQTGGNYNYTLLPFPLSARSDAALYQRVADLLSWLKSASDIRLDVLSHSLCRRRTVFERRMCVLAKSKKDLITALEGQSTHGEVPDALRYAVSVYIDGQDADWTGLVPDCPGLLTDLPAYPFQRRSCFRPARRIEAMEASGAVQLRVEKPDAPELALPRSGGLTFEHPTEDAKGQYVTVSFSEADFYLDEHRVAGQAILPGVMTLDLVARLATKLSAMASGYQIRDVIFSTPFEVVGTAEGRLRYVEQRNGAVLVRFYKCEGDSEKLCSQARLVPEAGDPPVAPLLSPSTLEKLCPESHAAAECYRLICASSIHHGPSLQALQVVRSGECDCLAQLEIPAAVRNAGTFELHPSMMDGALQALVGFAFGHEVDDLYLPFSIDEVRRYNPLPQRAIAHLRALPAENDERRLYDVSIADPNGVVAVTIRGFQHRKVSRQSSERRAPKLPEGAKSVLYVPNWQETDQVGSAVPQRVVVMESGSQALDDRLMAMLETEGHVVCLAGMTPRNGIAPSQALLVELLAKDQKVDAVLCPWELVDPVAHPNIEAWLGLLQIILRRSGHSRIKLVVLLPQNAGDNAFKQGLSALLRTAAQESPDLQVRTIHDVNADGPALAEACALGLDERAGVAVDLALGTAGNQPLRRVLTALSETAAKGGLRGPISGCVVITGGAGGIGRQLAEHAACVWNADVAILGRRSEDESITHFLSGLRGHGVRASYFATDVSQPEMLSHTLGQVRDAFNGIGGVIHCAGILGDRRLVDLDLAEFLRICAPKTEAVTILDRQTRGDALSFFVTMSSLGGLTGNAGQGPYSYASAVMDALMIARRRAEAAGEAQGHSLSLNWPLWADGGMHVDAESERYIRQTLGMVPLPGAIGVQLFELALSLPEPQIGVLVGESEKIEAFFEREAGHNRAATEAAGPTPTARRRGAEKLQSETVIDLVIGHVARVSGWNPEDLDTTENLSSYGFDSIMLTALTNEINCAHGIDLPPAEIFSHPTIVDLAQCLTKKYGEAFTANTAHANPASSVVQPTRAISGDAALHAGSDSRPEVRSMQSYEPIAVVGMAGRYPEADTLEKYWENLSQGRDSVRPVPASRWTGPRFESDVGAQPLCAYGAFLDNITAFEPGFFGISPAEAAMMDPQERLFLEVAQNTFDNAGYGRTRLDSALNGNVGVFVGVMWSEFQLFSSPEAGEIGSSPSTLANRVSYFYGLNGPSMSLDTMCSSSLTALHLACQSLRSGECRATLIGGVNMSLHPNKYARLARNRFSAPDGKCRAFGAGGQGYVPGEGIGAVLLRPLSDAQKAGDHIHAVIRSSAINHGGRTSGFTVPNGAAQAAVIKRALKLADINPTHITCIEAHGTGTPLGDPIEIYGLAKALGSQAPGHCSIGSVKTNIGHLEASAGMAGLHKLILQMQHRKLVPSLHADKLNPEIDFTKTPFRVNRSLTDWMADHPLRAGVSSFGAGGANAHVILEEAPLNVSGAKAMTGSQLIILSARTETSLRAYARVLAEYLDTIEDMRPPLADIAYSLCIGRDQMRVRAAMICETTEDLLTALRKFGVDEQSVWSFGNQSKGSAPQHVTLHSAERIALTAAMADWLDGATLIPEAVKGRLVPLPGYQFDRGAYWIDDSGYSRGVGSTAKPILASSVRLEGRTALQVVCANDPLASDHVIVGNTILPGAGVMEIARTSVEQINGSSLHVLEDVAWLAPAQLEAGADLIMRVELDNGEKGAEFRVLDAEKGRRLCQARIPANQTVSTNGVERLEELRARLTRAKDPTAIYKELSARGYAYGPLYRSMRALWVGDEESLAQVTLPVDLAADADRYLLHPSLVDGAFQSVLGVVQGADDNKAHGPYLPFLLKRVEIHEGTGSGPIWVHTTLAERTETNLRFNLTLYDGDGKVLSVLRGFTLRALPRRVAATASGPSTDVVADVSDSQTERAHETAKRFFVETLGLPKSDIGPDLILEDCGIDSIAITELMRELEETLDCQLSPSVFVGLRSFGDLVNAIVGQIGVERQQPVSSKDSASKSSREKQEPTAFASPRPTRASSSGHRKVALIGMACRVPGSMNEDEFWDHIVNERNLITEVPPERWDWRTDFDPKKGVPGKTYSKWNGFAPALGAYDVKQFRLSVEQALQMDPQQLLMMELARDAMENAGYEPREFTGKDTAVVIGAAARSLDTAAEALQQRNVVANRIVNMVAARVSDFFDLHGTSYTMDTACSSALVAMHDACRIILSGEAETALAGGVVMFTNQRSNIGFAQAQVLSDEGKCFVFDRRAKGIVLSEGAGLFLLKDFDRALADGDNIRAVILGSAVNNDGRTMGITTPNSIMQKEVIAQALTRAGIDARTIGCLEAHGTGTLLGDPIEIKAATEAYRAHTQDCGFCGVASVKSNIGHMLLASAAGSVVKVVKSLETGIIPATLHCEEPHPRFEFENSPFFPVQKTMRWPEQGYPRRAGVSSFGFGGTNAHMILEEFNADRAGHVCKREPLPRTRYERVPVWPKLGISSVGNIAAATKRQPISTPADAPQMAPSPAPAPGQNIAVPCDLEDLLGQLASGELSVEQALAWQDTDHSVDN